MPLPLFPLFSFAAGVRRFAPASLVTIVCACTPAESPVPATTLPPATTPPAAASTSPSTPSASPSAAASPSPATPPSSPGIDSTCALAVDPGPCKASKPRFYYDGATRACVPFRYGGCRGNANNFATKEECDAACPAR